MLLTEQSSGRHHDDGGGQQHQNREPDGHHQQQLFPRYSYRGDESIFAMNYRWKLVDRNSNNQLAAVKRTRASNRPGDPAQQGSSLNLGTKPGAGLGSVIGWRSARKLATGFATATMRCHAIGRGAEVTTGKEPHLGDRVTSFGNLVPGELTRLSSLAMLGLLIGGHRQKPRWSSFRIVRMSFRAHR